VLSNSSDIYMAVRKTDSAYARYKKMLSINDVHAKKFAYKRLAEYYLMKNDAARSLNCVNGYEQMLDSISEQNATEELARMDAIFNNQQKEQQINQLKETNSDYQEFVIVICFVVAFVFFGCVGFYFYLRSRRLSIRIKVEHKQQLDQDEYEQTDVFIKQNKEHIDEIERSITINNDDEDKVRILKELLRKLLSVNEISLLLKKDRERNRNGLKDTEEYKMLNDRLKNAAITNKKLSSDEWRRLEKVINERVENFKQRIEAICRLSEQEYRVCMLLKMEIEPSAIADITNRTRGAISLTRRRLYERAFGQKSGPDAWDRFILSL